VIVFSNTTPLVALASVDALHLLPALFQRVHVAESVAAECRAGGGGEGTGSGRCTLRIAAAPDAGAQRGRWT
jgi:predicted nucleic acid-binding protein